MKTMQALHHQALAGLQADVLAEIQREHILTSSRPCGHDVVEGFAKHAAIAHRSLDAHLPAQEANGGEILPVDTDLKETAPGLHDALTRPVTVVAAVATRERLEALSKAETTVVALDLAEQVGARGSLEKMVAAQIATSHQIAMQFIGTAHVQLQKYEQTLHPMFSVEASRAANTAVRLISAMGEASAHLEHLQAARRAARPRRRTRTTTVSVVKHTEEQQE